MCVAGAISPGSVAHQQLRRVFAALFTKSVPGAAPRGARRTDGPGRYLALGGSGE